MRRPLVRSAYVLALLLVVLSGSSARAQSLQRHWGVSTTWTPDWTTPNPAKVLFDADALTLKGNDWRIGVVRGRVQGSEWGISYVRKMFDDASSVERHTSACAGQTCGTFLRPDGVKLNGVEAHKFVSFGTITRRVQLGMTIGGGVGTLRGSLVRREKRLPGPTEIVSTIDAKELFAPAGTQLSVVPLVNLTFNAAAIVSRNLKVRVGGGVNTPGYEKFDIGVVYFFGR